MTQPHDLWSLSASQRLKAARTLTRSQLATVQEQLCEGCPVAPWPYGNATSINPMLVTLGPSPGNSPAPGDIASPACLELPPAGEPHPHVYYEDTKGYWDSVRHLARIMLTPSAGSENDAFALFGNMNLSPERSGSASKVKIDPSFARWVLRTIRYGLRPRWLVCLGLTTRLKDKENRTLRQAFESLLDLDIDKPDEKYPFESERPPINSKATYYFLEWEVPTGDIPLTVVFWSQHPSRPPLNTCAKWRSASERFLDRHAKDIEHI